MSKSPLQLFTTRRFLPLFATQFLGAFNDNFLKIAVVTLGIYQLKQDIGVDLGAAASALFIIPFFLFSATAGQLADKLSKNRMIAVIKAVEILIMCLAGLGFHTQNLSLLLGAIFMMGVHSAFFGPLKYSILPRHLKSDELMGGNAIIESATFLAILLGTLLGGALILRSFGIPVTSVVLVMVAAAGFTASLWIPKAEALDPNLKVDFNPLRQTYRLVKEAMSQRDLFLIILGISWFWLIGVVFLSLAPSYVMDLLGGNADVMTLILVVFSVGIGIGSFLSSKLLGNTPSATYAPLAAVGVTLFAVDLWFASPTQLLVSAGTLTIPEFLSHLSSWRILADFTLIAIFGGLFVVPLYALMQLHGEASKLSRIIAANNIVNAVFMVAGTMGSIVLMSLGMTIPHVFLVVAILNAGIAVWVCKLLPDALLKSIFAAILKIFYKVRIEGIENLPRDERVIIVVNHVSFLDGMLLAAFLPGRLTFAVNTGIAKRWWAKIGLILVDAVSLDPTRPLAAKTLTRAVEAGRHVVIFPEGRITVTGALMKVYEGPGMIADKTGATLVPIRIDGAQYSFFSRLKGKVKQRWFPKISLTILSPRKLQVDPALQGRARRQVAGTQLYDLMSELIFESCDNRQTLFEALLDAKEIHGANRAVLEDTERKPLTYGRLVASSLALGKKIARLTAPSEKVGVLLPNAVSSAITFLALQAYGRVPAMLNFTSGHLGMEGACRVADVRRILTSRRFIELARLEETVAILAKSAEIIYLEDVKNQIGIVSRWKAMLSVPFARHIHASYAPLNGADEIAAVLFTSGSEGLPKGVALSHVNILSNRNQLASRIDFTPSDIVFNALPIFHAFGLTGGLLLPLLGGVKTFLYPSPLHYRIIPELIYDTNSTILFGTDTFLTGWGKNANPYDLYSVRYVFAGAEKVRSETRALWFEKFGVRIFEGYGATETSPVLAINTPMHFKAGTVGRFLPGINPRLEHVPGIEQGGRLIIKGPNIMLGYLKTEIPGILQPPPEGEYDTGDIVSIDAGGFVTIQGRVKRFAKIAGEMVSLGAVEELAGQVWPGHIHVAVSIPDLRKGEQIVLLTEQEGAIRDELLAMAQAAGTSELAVPRQVIFAQKIPVLGTGKIDYVAAKALVLNLHGNA